MNDYGIPSDPITYGGGAGYIPFYTDLLKDNTALQLGQGSLGNDLLKNLTDLATNPASGPLGLAAYGAFGGGPQSVAAGTGGKGLVNPYSGSLDRALSGMMSGVFGNKGSIFNPDNGGQVNTNDTTFNDPNQAPAPSPTAAAKADNNQADLISAWEAYHPGQNWYDQVANRIAGGPVNLEHGGILPANPGPASEHLKKFVAGSAGAEDLADRLAKSSKLLKAAKDIREHGMEPATGSPISKNLATGGGVAVGGEPHYIVDGSGNVKANITEDGQPEAVTGIPGGIEVTPMNPVRQAAYETAKNWSRVLAGLDAKYGTPGNGVPGMATGGQYMFPSIPTSLVNTGAGGSGSNLLPSSGGPAAPVKQNPFKSTYDPTTGAFTLPSEATDATTANDNAGYAKLLGGAFDSNTAISPDVKTALNAGLAPSKLLSATALSTLPQSQQQDYSQFLQSALGVPAGDVAGMIRRFAPTSFT